MANVSLPNLEEWDRLSLQECEDVARTIAKQLPPSFRYKYVETHSIGSCSHRVAFFEWNLFSTPSTGVLFAFLPGGRMTLGYDKNVPFVPSAFQLKSWQEETVGKHYITDALEVFLEKALLPIRIVNLQPMLFQVVATNPATLSRFRGGKNIFHPPIHRADILALLAEEGFRLPSSDEWEYACGAEARTLFRWGNDTPQSPPQSEAPMSMGHIPGEWDLHLKPNAFGLFIGNSSFKWEFCTESEYMRGGDGGSAECAGVGVFAEWLVFATSYYEKYQPLKEGTYHAHFRRVYTLE
jgi:hypothetical protein